MTEIGTANPFKDDMTGKTLLGKYRIVRRLATGGMGVVYLARLEGAAGFAKPVVVKLILPLLASNEEFSGMFEREAKILASLQHPGIVGALDFAEEQNFNVMVLEYVHGFQLGQWRRFLSSQHRMIPTNVVIQIIINMLDALHYAHTLKNIDGEPMKIVHRDVSPSNIMLDTEGHVKLVDFGIAFAEQMDDGYKTTNKSFKGKLPYSAPELFASQSATVRSDVYAAGVTLHELLIGKNEFNLKDHASIIQAVLNHVPSSVHMVRDDAPERIDEVIWKALAKKPSHRFQSADEFAEALRDIVTIPEHKSLSMLADLVQVDFSADMSDYLGVESLTSRERAWRSPSILPEPHSGGSPADRQPDRVSGDAKTTTGREPRVTIPAKPTTTTRTHLTGATGEKRSTKWILVLAGVAVVAAVAVALYFGLNRNKPEERRFLLVQEDVPEQAEAAPAASKDTGGAQGEKATDGQASAGAAETAGDPSEPIDDDPAVEKLKQKNKRKGKTKRGAAGKPDPAALTAAFKKQKGKVQQCFANHPGDMEQGAHVSVLFHVQTSGKVQKADLSPRSMRGTALGKCLVSVSTATRFPPQSEPVTFRIPLTASRVKR